MMRAVKTFALLLLFSYGLMLYLALLQTAPGQPVQFHADAPLWLSLQALLSLWLSKKVQQWCQHRQPNAQILRQFSCSFSLSLLIFVTGMTALQVLIDWSSGHFLLRQQYVRIGLMYLLVHSLIAGAYLVWQLWQQQQQQQLALMQVQQQNQQYKLQLLQQQLEPHFLFNNLNVLSALIYKNPAQAADFLDDFADIYRYQLQQSQQPLVTLADELNFIERYLALLSHRFPGCFRLHYNISLSQRLSYQLVPCCLQLLVENAVKHNAAQQSEPLLISIELSQNDLVVRHAYRPKAFASAGTGTGLTNLTARCQSLLGRPLILIQTDEFIVQVPLRYLGAATADPTRSTDESSGH